MLDRLNYNHLRCFWATARAGSVAGACELLGLSQPTISKQIGDLEDALGEDLFRRTGRRLILTERGRTVQAYADDIFALGQELLDAVRGQVTGKPLFLHAGVSDVVPKLLTRLVLEPALRMGQPVRLICREGKTEQLGADLALGGLDLIITDAPLAPGTRIKAYTHTLRSSPVAWFGVEPLAGAIADDFPRALTGAPVLLPTENTTLRRSIDAWLDAHDLHPQIVGEFEDAALLKTFAEGGHGLFVAPTDVARQLALRYGVVPVGPIEGVTETVYAITAERRVHHPGVVAILEGAPGA